MINIHNIKTFNYPLYCSVQVIKYDSSFGRYFLSTPRKSLARGYLCNALCFPKGKIPPLTRQIYIWVHSIVFLLNTYGKSSINCQYLNYLPQSNILINISRSNRQQPLSRKLNTSSIFRDKTTIFSYNLGHRMLEWRYLFRSKFIN